MDRYAKQFFYTLEQDVTALYGTVAIGGTGAVGAIVGLGIVSVTRTGTGAYTIKGQPFNKLMNFQYIFAGTASGLDSVELSQTLATQKSDIQAGNVRIACFAGGVATDPASGSVLQFTIVARNSSVGPA